MSDRSSAIIDLAYRPRTYFWADAINLDLSSTIKGAARKLLYERSLAEGVPLPPQLAKPALTAHERRAWSRLHPSLMGGEFLPDRKVSEVEIARIAIASTTQDVTVVYARACKGRIHYRVVDEYEGGTLSGRPARTSVRPLALGELLDFFIGAWNLLGVLNMNFEDDGHPPDTVHGFITDASSSFYAQFGLLIHHRINAWLESVRTSSRTGSAQARGTK